MNAIEPRTTSGPGLVVCPQRAGRRGGGGGGGGGPRRAQRLRCSTGRSRTARVPPPSAAIMSN
ncbi:hypothetical protein, partial [Streptomyces harbinensis]|uniref:hypothetical protein n=1 Tax=Streptomyces harbinensis TaxID=1176198 RepID=UPI0034DF6F9F